MVCIYIHLFRCPDMLGCRRLSFFTLVCLISILFLIEYPIKGLVKLSLCINGFLGQGQSVFLNWILSNFRQKLKSQNTFLSLVNLLGRVVSRFSSGLGYQMPIRPQGEFRKTRTHSKARNGCHVLIFFGSERDNFIGIRARFSKLSCHFSESSGYRWYCVLVQFIFESNIHL